jgi:hypothetical protein
MSTRRDVFFSGAPPRKTQFSQLTARLPQSYDYRISFLLTRTWFIYHWTQAPVLRITLHKRLRVCAPRDFHSHHCSPRGLLREQRSTPAHSNTAASSTPGGATLKPTFVNTRGRLTQPLFHFSPLLRDFHIILTEHIKVSRAAGPPLLSKTPGLLISLQLLLCTGHQGPNYPRQDTDCQIRVGQQARYPFFTGLLQNDRNDQIILAKTQIAKYESGSRLATPFSQTSFRTTGMSCLHHQSQSEDLSCLPQGLLFASICTRRELVLPPKPPTRRGLLFASICTHAERT